MSVLGLLKAREKKVREEVAGLREEAERVQAALGEAERALQRLVDARVTVTEVLTEPPLAAAGPAPRAVAGSLVPHRIEGMAASVLAPDYHLRHQLADRASVVRTLPAQAPFLQ
ncbi:hypothetical protein ABZY09_46385 [Streptomyces sp. NPDC002928]|uniref:hypothetical protein n=1 Tax=Streptomyces sp. NPDC002928 TaxID=3154440 RepID=UPI0033A1475D